jgi:hypothetical protein
LPFPLCLTGKGLLVDEVFLSQIDAEILLDQKPFAAGILLRSRMAAARSP